MCPVTNVIFLTSAAPESINRNFNFFQRVWFLSRDGEMRLTILARRGADFSRAAVPEAKIVHARIPGKPGLFLLAFRFLLRSMFTRRAAGERPVLLIEPSILNLCGPFYKMFGYRWAVDVWDIPIRQTRFSGPFARFLFRLKKRMVRFSFRFADLFILSIRPELEFTFFRVPAEKVKTFRNAVFLPPGRPERLPLTPRGGAPFEIICVRSTYTGLMGLDILTRAFLKLTAAVPDCRLTVIGVIPREIEPQIEPIRGLENVRFIPQVPNEQLQKMIASSHTMVIPFRRTPDLEQTYPIKLFEAMLRGAVPVVPALAGICAVIRHGENGLVYTPDSPDALAAALARLYDDDPLRIRLAERAYGEIGEFDCAEKNRRIAALLKELARK